jgi:hypothetical protein
LYILSTLSTIGEWYFLIEFLKLGFQHIDLPLDGLSELLLFAIILRSGGSSWCEIVAQGGEETALGLAILVGIGCLDSLLFGGRSGLVCGYAAGCETFEGDFLGKFRSDFGLYCVETWIVEV